MAHLTLYTICSKIEEKGKKVIVWLLLYQHKSE